MAVMHREYSFGSSPIGSVEQDSTRRVSFERQPLDAAERRRKFFLRRATVAAGAVIAVAVGLAAIDGSDSELPTAQCVEYEMEDYAPRADLGNTPALAATALINQFPTNEAIADSYSEIMRAFAEDGTAEICS